MEGKLTIVGTPIGNMMDITIRALRALRECDVVIAEDTRRTKKLLKFFNIDGKQLISYGLHNQLKSVPFILNLLKEGKNFVLSQIPVCHAWQIQEVFLLMPAGEVV